MHDHARVHKPGVVMVTSTMLALSAQMRETRRESFSI